MTGHVSNLLFSAGSVDITPNVPLCLAGYGNRTAVCQGINDKLEANAVLLKHGDSFVVILSLDLLYVGKEIRSRLLQRLNGRVNDEALLVCATHTHFAPATDPSKPLLGRSEETYINFVVERLDRLLDSLFKSSLEAAVISYGSGLANHSVNRRLFRRMVIHNLVPRFNAILLAPSADGPRNEAIQVLRVEHSSGETACVLWNYSCHPVGSPKRNCISADYPGIVRTSIRKAFGQAFPVLFLQGFSGDIRPRDTRKKHGPKDRLLNLVLGPSFSGFTELEWKEWVNSLSALVVDATASARQVLGPFSGGISSGRIEVALTKVLPNAPEDRVLSFHRLDLGRSVRFVGISAEAVVAWTDFVKTNSRNIAIVIPVGDIDDTFGYLPTQNMIERGGYEGGEFMEGFSLSGPWSRDFESQCRAALRDVLNSNDEV